MQCADVGAPVCECEGNEMMEQSNVQFTAGCQLCAAQQNCHSCRELCSGGSAARTYSQCYTAQL